MSNQLGIVGMLFISLIFIGLGATAMSAMWGDLATEYDKDNTENISALDMSISIANRQKDVKDSMDEDTTNEDDSSEVLWKGAFNSVRLLFGVGDDATNFTTTAGVQLGLPSDFTTAIILIIAGVITLVLMGALIKARL